MATIDDWLVYMAFTIKGQTKAAMTFKGNFGVYGPILFKVCMQVADWPSLMICYMAFTIKGQTKATAAFKVNISVYGLSHLDYIDNDFLRLFHPSLAAGLL